MPMVTFERFMHSPSAFRSAFAVFLAIGWTGCANPNGKNQMNAHRHTNELVNETSPYLLQHAHNPVNWHAWNERSLAKAREENKLLLISIGYSTCHWCHVMERESFEDSTIAAFMNEHFVSIKVDREERPDIDHIYMQAVQMMTGRGGWPLNCIALPDGKPLFGGTYFPREQWLEALKQIAQAWAGDPDRCRKYADEVTAGIRQASLVQPSGDALEIVTKEGLAEAVRSWSATFDPEHGGPDRAPKFPMPVNYRFLLRYHYHTGDRSVLEHVSLTLNRMAMGGIYDAVGGGFARYSTDAEWKVPHFEKMLYDNAQLVSLYADAFRATGNPLYKSVVYETLAFVARELTDNQGGFYSALDADSEGEEGKFYVWTRDEIDSLLGDHASLFSDVYNINKHGLWEHGNHILLRRASHEVLAEKHKLGMAEYLQILESCREKLLSAREQRIRPGLDDKVITSWNALMITACCDAFDAFREPRFLAAAEKAMGYIEKNLMSDDRVFHSTHPSVASAGKKPAVMAFLDDMALLTRAYLSLYESTGKASHLMAARHMADAAIDGFFDDASGMFRFTHDDGESLIAPKIEMEDNVIPSSNSVMAGNLFRLSRHLDRVAYEKTARHMLSSVRQYQASYPSAFANWHMLALDFLYPFHELVVTGKEAEAGIRDIRSRYLPNVTTAMAESESELPLLKGRFVPGQTLVYVCTNKSCRLPVPDTQKALGLVEK